MSGKLENEVKKEHLAQGHAASGMRIDSREQERGMDRKLRILGEAAKYDVACTSSGVNKSGRKGGIGNAVASGICHTFAADGRCISLLKILLTNYCIFDCKYCMNRASNDVERAAFTPREAADLTIQFYRRNYIEGLFLSSGVIESPSRTMELLYECLRILREEYRFHGYIHVKGIPGADSRLIEKIGYLADRMSVNLELPSAESLRELAPNKTRQTIVRPMVQIRNRILEQSCLPAAEQDFGKMFPDGGGNIVSAADGRRYDVRRTTYGQSRFVPAGQSTQMIIGATPETDYQIMTVTEAMYRKFRMKRVFYSAYVDVNRDGTLPAPPGGPPLLREHRLYQADWLLRFYGFESAELLSEKRPNFNVYLDPKCDWALRHIEQFPVDVNRADYYRLLRVPGIGPAAAQRIVTARRHGSLDYIHLKKMGVVLKRAVYFISCSGHRQYHGKMEEDALTRQMLYADRPRAQKDSSVTYEQLSLFDDQSFMKGQADGIWNG